MENFLELGLPWPKGMQVASIGPITSKTARDLGLKIDIEASRHDIDGLVEGIRDFFSKKARTNNAVRKRSLPPIRIHQSKLSGRIESEPGSDALALALALRRCF